MINKTYKVLCDDGTTILMTKYGDNTWGMILVDLNDERAFSFELTEKDIKDITDVIHEDVAFDD